ncbi:MAG: hypothetical protein AAFQ89_10745 [Cyanobacteria bacterium J06626_18]
MSDLLPSWRTNRKQSSALARRQTTAVQVLVRRHRRLPLPRVPLPPLSLARRFLKLGGITFGLLGAGGLVGLCLWTSVVLILRPHPPRWLVQAMPYLVNNWSDQPIQSWDEIKAELQTQGSTARDLIGLDDLGKDPKLNDLKLLPVVGQRSSCTRNCEAIVELRLYRVLDRNKQELLSLQLLDQLVIQGPPEEHVVDPVWQGNVGMVGSTHPLPLLNVKSIHKQGLPGIWLTLTGRWQNQGSPILYGQVLHVDLQTLRINSLLNWASATGRLPIWQDLDSEDLPELVVSQSVGLEPHFSSYSVANTTAAVAVRLQEISLRKLPFPEASLETQYHNALFLAQHGLWSDAQERLTQLKTQLAESWPQELEQQMQLIALHARVSQSQADRTWSRADQKLLALLLNGQWETALETMGTSQSFFEAVVLPLLQQDSSRLWQRVTASLQVEPTEKATRLWGALLRLAKEDKEAALKWLIQNQSTIAKQEFEALMDKVQPEPEEEELLDTTVADAAGTIPVTTEPEPRSEKQPSSSGLPEVGGLFGTARPLESVSPATWRWPSGTPDMTLSTGQQWYRITLQAGHIGRQWDQLAIPDGSSPEAIAAFWRSLGFNTNPALYLASAASNQTPQTVRVRAIRLSAGTIELLATGTSPPATDIQIVTTPNQWVMPQQVSAQPLSQIYRDQPQLGERLLTTLSNQLGVDPTLLSSAFQEKSAAVGTVVTVRRVDFTGDQESELLLTIDAQSWPYEEISLPTQGTIQIVLNSQGEILYSSLREGGVLVGWLAPDTSAPALVTNQGGSYDLRVWSQQQQQFR